VVTGSPAFAGDDKCGCWNETLSAIALYAKVARLIAQPLEAVKKLEAVMKKSQTSSFETRRKGAALLRMRSELFCALSVLHDVHICLDRYYETKRYNVIQH
jgi:hypothetical protein